MLTVYFCKVFVLFTFFTYRFMVPLSTLFALYFTQYLTSLFFHTVPRYHFAESLGWMDANILHLLSLISQSITNILSLHS